MWADHRRAVHHMEQLGELLNQLEAAGRDVGIYRRYYVQWWDVVFAWESSGWKATGSGRIDDTLLEPLQLLADMLRVYKPGIKPGGLEALRKYAGKVQEIVNEDDSVPPDMRIHVREVVSHVLRCIDEYEKEGDFSLQDAVERLVATVVRAAANSSEENRRMWGPAMSNIVWPWIVGFTASLPSSALSAVLALTAGGG